MPEKKQKGRDYPLSPTPSVAARDNTRYSIKEPTHFPAPKFTYKDTEFTKKDSSDYRRGFKYGINRKSNKNLFGGEHELGKKSWVGLNDRFNEGFSEGKDVRLSKKKNK